MRCWDIASGKQEWEHKGHRDDVSCLAISTDGRVLVSSSWDGSVHFLDPTTGESKFPAQHHDFPATCGIAIRPPQVWTCAENGGINRWTLTTGAREFGYQVDHTDALRCFALSGDAQFAVTGSLDATVFLWDLREKRLVRQFAGHQGAPVCVAITPDDQYVLSGTSRPDSRVRVFELKSGRLRHEFPPHDGMVRAVAVSPSGRYAVSAGDDRSVRIYDLQALLEVGRILAFDYPVFCARFSPDGRHIMAGGKEMVAKLFRLPALPG